MAYVYFYMSQVSFIQIYSCAPSELGTTSSRNLVFANGTRPIGFQPFLSTPVVESMQTGQGHACFAPLEIFQTNQTFLGDFLGWILNRFAG